MKLFPLLIIAFGPAPFPWTPAKQQMEQCWLRSRRLSFVHQFVTISVLAVKPQGQGRKDEGSWWGGHYNKQHKRWQSERITEEPDSGLRFLVPKDLGCVCSAVKFLVFLLAWDRIPRRYYSSNSIRLSKLFSLGMVWFCCWSTCHNFLHTKTTFASLGLSMN